MVIIVVGAYYVIEDVFSYYGFKVYPPKTTFTDLLWREKEPEKEPEKEAEKEPENKPLETTEVAKA